jgi:iron complex outermembrane receptor protein
MDKSKASIDFQDKDSQLGIYAQEHMKIADRLVVMLGGRYDKAEAKSTNYLNGQSGTTYDEGVFTGRAGLVYLFDNGIAPYASFSQSFQPTAGQDFGGQPYKPSEGEQYEVGVRYQPPGRNASVTASVYQLTQTNVFTADPVNSGFYVQEGEVRSRGFELEGRASLASNLNLIASYSYIDNVVTKSNSGTEGNRFAGVPKHMASLWADYQFTGSLRDLRIGAGIRYFGQSYNLANTVKVPDYTVVDAVVSYNITPDWSVSLNVNNLFDEEYVTCVNACYYGTERSVFVKTSYRW